MLTFQGRSKLCEKRTCIHMVSPKQMNLILPKRNIPSEKDQYHAWLPMPWLLESPVHQQRWCWLCWLKWGKLVSCVYINLASPRSCFLIEKSNLSSPRCRGKVWPCWDKYGENLSSESTAQVHNQWGSRITKPGSRNIKWEKNLQRSP